MRWQMFCYGFFLVLAPVFIAGMCAAADVQAFGIDSMQILQDRDEIFGPSDVITLDEQHWREAPHHLFIEGAVWLKAAIRVDEPAVGQSLDFSLKNSFPIDTEFWVFDSLGMIIDRSRMGSNVPFSEWPRFHTEAVHEFKVNKPGSFVILAKIRNDRVTSLSSALETQVIHQPDVQKKSILFGIMFGGLLAIFFYNLILWRTLNRQMFLQFSGVIALYIASALQLSGALSAIIATIDTQIYWVEAMVPRIAAAALFGFFTIYLKKQRYLWKGRILRYLSYSLLTFALMGPMFPQTATMAVNIINPLGYTLLMYMTLIECRHWERTPILIALGTIPLYGIVMIHHLVPADIFQIPIRNFLPVCYVIQILAIGAGLTNGISELRHRLVSALNSRVDSMEKLVKQRTAEVLSANEILKNEIAIRRQAEVEAIKRSHQIQEAQSQLISSSRLRALGEMASGVSHEINNPLTILKGYLYLIQNAAEKDHLSISKISDLCGKAMMTADRMANVVRGLREFALQDEIEDACHVNVKRSWDITFNLLQERMANAGIKCRIETFSDHLFVWARPADLTQSLLSLINFCAESTQNSRKRWVAASVTTGETMITIKISHSGEKLSPEISDKIFTPFFVGSDIPGGGTLGISIAKKLMTSVGGDLRYASEAQHPTFEISLRRVATEFDRSKQNEEAS